MKKYLTKGLVILSTIALVLSLASCNLFKNMNVEVNADATGKDSSLELLTDFFTTTLEQPDYIVTYNSKGVKQYTENIKGTTSHLIRNDDTISCAFMNGDKYCYVSTSKDIVDGNVVESRFYVTSDESKEYYSEYAQTYYEGSYCEFMNNIKIIDYLKDSDGEFTCVFHSEGTTEESTGNVEFKFVSNTGYMTITGESKNDLVQTVEIIVVDNENESGNRNITMSFKYGDAYVSIPDLDKWAEEDFKVDEEEEEEEDDPNTLAIKERDDFLGEGHAFADGVTVTCRNNGAFVYSETISNGIDKIDYGTRQTYTYAKENDNDYDYYYVYVDASSKYYKVNDPTTYGSNHDKYYNESIALYDSSTDSLEFTCEVEGDTMTFTVKQEDTVLYLITATRVDGYITSVVLTIPDLVLFLGSNELTFEYNVEALTEPDLTDFENRS